MLGGGRRDAVLRTSLLDRDCFNECGWGERSRELIDDFVNHTRGVDISKGWGASLQLIQRSCVVLEVLGRFKLALKTIEGVPATFLRINLEVASKSGCQFAEPSQSG